jgi:hypothetical protein
MTIILIIMSIPIAIPIYDETVTIPISIYISDNKVKGADGNLYLNSNVKCQYKINGVEKWYNGKITNIFSNNICEITYEEYGMTVQGNAKSLYSIKDKRKSCLPMCIPYFN